MSPARRNPARKDESAQLSAMFAEAGWAPADQHFRERPFVIWHGSFYSASGTPPNASPCSKACQTAEEVLAFLHEKTAAATTPPSPSVLRRESEALIDDLRAPKLPNERKREDELRQGPDRADDGLRVDNRDFGRADPGGDDHLGHDVDIELNDAIEEHPEVKALREQVAELQRQLAERDAEPPPLSPDPVKHMIPDEIRKLMEDGESLSNAKRRLTELLWVEQAELRNLRGTDRGDLKREAEIERLLGLFARLGEI